MRRRRALQLGAAVVTGASAGCVGGVLEYETYQFEQAAPVHGPAAAPWATLAHDARRSGFVPEGRLPQRVATRQFSPARLTRDVQPAFVGGTAYFGADQFDPEVLSWQSGFTATDHRERGWFVDQRGPAASPTVVGNAVFVSTPGLTRAFDRRDGTLCWSYEAGRGLPTTAPTVVDDTIYITGEKLFALTADTGEVRWATDRQGTILRGTAVTEQALYATGGNDGPGTVRRFDLETGEQRWAVETEHAPLVPPVVDDLIYVVESNGWLRALEPASGEEVWSTALGGRSSAMPVVGSGTVYAVATDGDVLFALDATSGEPRWKYAFDASWAVGPTLTEHALFLPTGRGTGGSVDVLDPATGRRRRTIELPRGPVSPLIVGQGVGLIATTSPSAHTVLYVLARAEE